MGVSLYSSYTFVVHVILRFGVMWNVPWHYVMTAYATLSTSPLQLSSVQTFLGFRYNQYLVDGATRLQEDECVFMFFCPRRIVDRTTCASPGVLCASTYHPRCTSPSFVLARIVALSSFSNRTRAVLYP